MTVNVSPYRRNSSSTRTTPYDQLSRFEYDSDIDFLLRRWGRWLRAGSSGLARIGKISGLGDQEYSDPVAEMLDQVIAQLPGGHNRRNSQREAVMAIWLYRQSETATADAWHMPRARFKTILNTAIVWLSVGLASRIDAEPTLENVEIWEMDASRRR